MDDLYLPLEVDGFFLREFQEDDVPRLSALANDYEIWRRLTDIFPRPYDREAGLKWVLRQIELDPPQNLVIAGPDGLVGGVGVMLSDIPNYRHDGELGYWLGRPYWGRGLTSAAVKAFCSWAGPMHGLMRLTAKVYEDNAGSIRVLEKSGFEREGVLERGARKEGALLDLHIYGLLL